MSRVINILCLFMLLVGCQSPVKTGVLQTSFSIDQAKQNDVFLAEYIPSSKTIITDKGEITITEVWIENYWEYENQEKVIRNKGSARGLIKLVDNDSVDNIKFTINGRENGIAGNKLTFKVPEGTDKFSAIFHGILDVEIDFIKR